MKRATATCVGNRNRCAAGFTLLEVLVSLLLVGALVMLLWSMLDTHFRFFEAGSRRTEQAQLARSVLSRLSDDLTCCVPVRRPPRESVPSPGVGNRATGELIGERTALRFLVLRSQPARFRGRVERSNTELARREELVDELKAVVYEMQGDAKRPPGEDRDGERYAMRDDGTAGVLAAPRDRRDVARFVRAEFPCLSGAAPTLPRRFHPRSQIEFHGAAENPVPELHQVESADVRESIATSVSGPSDDGPRISAMEFRYFDGDRWHDRWNARTRGRLPTAIEVRLTVTEQRPAAATAATPPTDGEADDRPSPVGGLDANDAVVRRFVFLEDGDARSTDALSDPDRNRSPEGIDSP